MTAQRGGKEGCTKEMQMEAQNRQGVHSMETENCHLVSGKKKSCFLPTPLFSTKAWWPRDPMSVAFGNEDGRRREGCSLRCLEQGQEDDTPWREQLNALGVLGRGCLSE